MPTPAVRFPELGYYTLPGHVAHPGQVVEEVRAGAALGLGSVWISERLNTKSVEVLSGVAAGIVFHEAMGHRLEGERLVSRSEGHTFAGKLGHLIQK